MKPHAEYSGTLSPLDLLMKEMGRIYECKKISPEHRTSGIIKVKKTLYFWQSGWDSYEKQQRGRKSLYQICQSGLLENGAKLIICHVIQFVTGHGVYYKNLFKIRKVSSSLCQVCSVEDDPEHTVFHCLRWQEQLDQYMIACNDLRPDR